MQPYGYAVQGANRPTLKRNCTKPRTKSRVVVVVHVVIISPNAEYVNWSLECALGVVANPCMSNDYHTTTTLIEAVRVPLPRAAAWSRGNGDVEGWRVKSAKRR